jgi:hypothetical protein
VRVLQVGRDDREILHVQDTETERAIIRRFDRLLHLVHQQSSTMAGDLFRVRRSAANLREIRALSNCLNLRPFRRLDDRALGE